MNTKRFAQGVFAALIIPGAVYLIFALLRPDVFWRAGEAVSHIAAELRGSAPMRLLGLPEEVVIGKSQELFAYYGLTPEGISAAIKERLERE